MSKQRPIAYGSLYLDVGEDMFHAFQQIDGLSKDKPVAFFFDVVCTEAQNEQAQLCANVIVKRIQDTNKKMRKSSIIVGVTNEESNRPAFKRMNMLLDMLKTKPELESEMPSVEEIEQQFKAQGIEAKDIKITRRKK